MPLFSSYVFSRHAYPERVPHARSLCPSCGAVHVIRYDATHAKCDACGHAYNPQDGPAKGTKATCGSCGTEFAIAKVAQARGEPPAHRLYAKLVLTPDGHKVYMPTDDFDRALYEQARTELTKRVAAYPVVPIKPGYNTNQAIKYGYTHWHQMFDDRQLLCLSILVDRIRAIPDETEREAFSCLLSGVLEFNNMFASFKGEGTGAVRHMFSHHILKPERTPLEANVWGTPKSSGAFSTLFESRILRAVEYAENPFELRVSRRNGKVAGEKEFDLSVPLTGRRVTSTFSELERDGDAYVSCGDSSRTDIVTGVVDAVITDPPFFDNVHYSQLADFFFVWQRHITSSSTRPGTETTRSDREVQHGDPAEFGARITAVWRECHRVLKNGGLLAFTYHHSRPEGWGCLLASLMDAGFVVTCAQPIKAEMSVAAPKQQAREPIDLDVVLVCRKRGTGALAPYDHDRGFSDALGSAKRQVQRFRKMSRKLSRNDLRVILTAQVFCQLSKLPSREAALVEFDALGARMEAALDAIGASFKESEGRVQVSD